MQLTRAVLAAVVLAASPALSAAPCAGFNDISDSDPFCVFVEWMKNRSITLGLTPTQYDPTSFVTRMQMAAFMYRLGSRNAFLQGGSEFGAPAVLGTTDEQPMDVRVNGERVMRYEPNAVSPNVIGGSPANFVGPGVRGATIAGGGLLPDTDPVFGNEAPNRVTDPYGTVGGGYGNQAGDDVPTGFSGVLATVAGGLSNSATGSLSTIAGGFSNLAAGGTATIGGGEGNRASGNFSTVSGGNKNLASQSMSTVGGGSINIASGGDSTVSGGFSNEASGPQSAVGGGFNNTANAFYATVAGGDANVASGSGSTVTGGRFNTASGTNSAIPGGIDNTASGEYSFAAGRRANAATNGAFVWADSRTFLFSSTGGNTFNVRSTGGVSLVVAINGSTGVPTQFCNLSPGVVGWSCFSDRDSKENYQPVAGGEILDRLASMPLYTYTLKGADPALRNLGPTAQDFYSAFGLGSDDKTIAGTNLLGAVVASIQGLNAKVEAERSAKDGEIAALRAELRSVRDELAAVRAALPALSAAQVVAARNR